MEYSQSRDLNANGLQDYINTLYKSGSLFISDYVIVYIMSSYLIKVENLPMASDFLLLMGDIYRPTTFL